MLHRLIRLLELRTRDLTAVVSFAKEWRISNRVVEDRVSQPKGCDGLAQQIGGQPYRNPVMQSTHHMMTRDIVHDDSGHRSRFALLREGVCGFWAVFARRRCFIDAPSCYRRAGGNHRMDNKRAHCCAGDRTNGDDKTRLLLLHHCGEAIRPGLDSRQPEDFSATGSPSPID